MTIIYLLQSPKLIVDIARKLRIGSDIQDCGFVIKSLLHVLLLQRSLLPGGIILQGVLLLQGSKAFFLRATNTATHVSHLDGVFCLPLA
jgi:hypothetical protein